MHTGIYPYGPMHTSKAEYRTQRAVPTRTLHVSCERTPMLLWLADSQWRWRVERQRVVGVAGSRTAAVADGLARAPPQRVCALASPLQLAPPFLDTDLIGRLYIPYVNFCRLGARCTPDTRWQQLWRRACSIAALGYSAHAMSAC